MPQPDCSRSTTDDLGLATYVLYAQAAAMPLNVDGSRDARHAAHMPRATDAQDTLPRHADLQSAAQEGSFCARTGPWRRSATA